MISPELVQRTVRAGAMARHFSLGELMDLHAHQPLLERLGKVGFAKMVGPFIPDCLPGELKGLRRMSSGGEQVAYSDGRNVLKVVFCSISPDADEVETAVHEHQTRFDLGRRYMGNHLAATTYSRLSLYGWYAVGALQEHQQPLNSFRDVQDMVANCDSPSYRRQLGGFAGSVTELHDNTAFYPDLNGEHNVVMTCSGLRVIDNMLVTPEMQRLIDGRTQQSIGALIASKVNFIQQAANVSRKAAWSPAPACH